MIQCGEGKTGLVQLLRGIAKDRLARESGDLSGLGRIALNEEAGARCAVIDGSLERGVRARPTARGGIGEIKHVQLAEFEAMGTQP